MTHYVSEQAINRDLNKVSDSLLDIVTQALEEFKQIDENGWSYRSADKWSKKEILGHLIDSAANNHIRFVKAQIAPKEFIGAGYEQNFFVSSQQYQQRKSVELIELWAIYNRHIAHVIKHLDSSKLDVKCKIGDNEPVTLLFLIEDYIGHIKHHLRQILG